MYRESQDSCAPRPSWPSPGPQNLSRNSNFNVDNEDDDFFEDNEDYDDIGDSFEETEEDCESRSEKSEKPTELKEQIYRDKLSGLKRQLQQLKDGTHPLYVKKVQRLEAEYQERLRLNSIYRDYLTECVERDYLLERKLINKELEEQEDILKENLMADIEEKKRIIEADRYTNELLGETLEIKPVLTRKLRRRPNEPVVEKIDKRRKISPLQLNLLLEEKEIENDLKAINRGKVVSSFNRPGISNSPQRPVINEIPIAEIRVEDSKLCLKLTYDKRTFHRGQLVYVMEEHSQFCGHISEIAADAIWVRTLADNSKIKMHISQLCQKKYILKHRGV